jgi:hypothetical protein
MSDSYSLIQILDMLHLLQKSVERQSADTKRLYGHMCQELAIIKSEVRACLSAVEPK